MQQQLMQQTASGPKEQLEQTLAEKRIKLTQLNLAINDHLNLKRDYLHKSNQIKLNPVKIQEELKLKKPPTEKQTTAFIEEKLQVIKDDLDIRKRMSQVSKERLNSWMITSLFTNTKYNCN